jgi:glycine cleavage system aminomethyltransferase T
MSLAEETKALRGSVAWSRLDHVAHVRIRGEGAYERLDQVVPSALNLRDGQMLHTMLLDEAAAPIADAYIAWDDEEFFLLTEGLGADQLLDHLRPFLPESDGFEIENLTKSHAIVALDGPYAWELLGKVLDPEAIGLPYLTFYHLDGWTCCRAGKTGEFGYAILLPAGEAETLEHRLESKGAALDARRATLEALDQCALENWFFNIRREGQEPVTPIELQLQWRVAYDKEFVGSAALRERRRAGARQRLTSILAGDAVAVGEKVVLEGVEVGRVVNAGYSHMLGAWVALALIDIAWAHPGITVLRVGPEGVSARSVSPPVLNNRSLAISPQLHSYHTRDQHPMPDLVRYPL